jgi:hypothetical protein
VWFLVQVSRVTATLGGGSTLSNTKGVCCTGVAAPEGGSTDIWSAGALERRVKNTQVNSPPHEAGRRMHEAGQFPCRVSIQRYLVHPIQLATLINAQDCA